MTFDHYVAIMLKPNGLYHMLVIPSSRAKTLTRFKYNDRVYHWNYDAVSRLIGWFPWQRPSLNPFLFLWQWLERRFVSVGIVFYREGENDQPITFGNYISKGYDRVSPVLFRSLILSKLYKEYEKSTNWGKKVSTNLVILVTVAFVIIFIILYLSGIISFGGRP